MLIQRVFRTMRGFGLAVLAALMCTTASAQVLPQLVYETEAQTFHQNGRAEGDGWAVNTVQDKPGYLVYGPYTTAVPAGRRRAAFVLMIDNNSADNMPVVDVDVYAAVSGTVLASQRVTRKMFIGTLKYQVFTLDFDVVAGQNLEFRTYWHGIAYIRQDKVAVSDLGGGDAVFVSQSVPETMTVGRTYSVSISMRNSGTTAWTKAAGFKLGAQNPENNTLWAGVDRVELVAGETIAPGQTKEFTFNVSAPAVAGTYNFQWKMLREYVAWFGPLSSNVAVSVGAAADTSLPVVSIGSPANGASVSGSVNITASASDNIGVSKVEFYVDGVLKGTDTSSPYSYSLDTLALSNGSHSLQAKAYDAAGNTAQAQVSVTVDNADTVPPSVPQGVNAAVISSSQINLTWSGSSDNVGVAGYRVYRDGAQIGTSAATAFQCTGLSALTAYRFSVAAYDGAGNASAQSSVVSATTPSAPIGTPGAASMQDFWAGNASFVYQRRFSLATDDMYYAKGANVSMDMVVANGTWYLFYRQIPLPPLAAYCTQGYLRYVVRSSTDKGRTWSAPVPVVSPVPNGPNECTSADGGAYYDQSAGTWHLLFQCSARVYGWMGCHASVAAPDPMRPFTLNPGNPVITGGSIWRQIMPGTNIFDEGTFEIVEKAGEYFYVTFHGYDGTNGYRGVVKTRDFKVYEPINNGPIFDRTDCASWNFNGETGGCVGGGAATTLKDSDGFYYKIIEASDRNLACTSGQNWTFGLMRSRDIAAHRWESLPRNPIVTDPMLRGCGIQYPNLFKDANGDIYFMFWRTSSNQQDLDPASGIYLYKLTAGAPVADFNFREGDIASITQRFTLPAETRTVTHNDSISSAGAVQGTIQNLGWNPSAYSATPPDKYSLLFNGTNSGLILNNPAGFNLTGNVRVDVAVSFGGFPAVGSSAWIAGLPAAYWWELYPDGNLCFWINNSAGPQSVCQAVLRGSTLATYTGEYRVPYLTLSQNGIQRAAVTVAGTGLRPGIGPFRAGAAAGAASGSFLGTLGSLKVNGITSLAPTRVLAVSAVAGDSRTFVANTSAQSRPMSVAIPAGSFQSDVILTMKVPEALPAGSAARDGLNPTGAALEIVLDQPVQPSKPVAIDVSYTDSEMEGVDREKLVLARYDDTSGAWMRLESVSYPEQNKVVGETDHFSLFQIMEVTPAAVATGLDALRIYPNPFYPNKGQTQVTIDGLPEGASVKIYTLNGELVWEGKAGGAGSVAWSGRNRAGRKVASGLYLTHFESGGKKKVKKLSVVK